MKQTQILQRRLQETIPFNNEKIRNEDFQCQQNKRSDHNKQEKLNTLTISYIYFQKIQPIIKDLMQDKLSKIEQLKINNCDLRTLQNFPTLPRLADLNLSKNSLQGSFEFLVKNRTICYLDISDNIVKDIKKLQPLRRLKNISLYANNNPFCINRCSGKGSTSAITSKETITSKLKALGILLLKEPKKNRIITNQSRDNCDAPKKENNIRPSYTGGINKPINKQKKANTSPFSVRNAEEHFGLGRRINSIRDLLRQTRQDINLDNNHNIQFGAKSRNSLSRNSSIDDLRFLTERSRQLLRLRQRSRDLDIFPNNNQGGRSDRSSSNLNREASNQGMMNHMTNMHRRIINIEDDLEEQQNLIPLFNEEPNDRPILNRSRTYNGRILQRMRLNRVESEASDNSFLNLNNDNIERQIINNSNTGTRIIENNPHIINAPQNQNKNKEEINLSIGNANVRQPNQQNDNQNNQNNNQINDEAEQGWDSDELQQMDLDEQLEQFEEDEIDQQINESSQNQFIMGFLDMSSVNRSSNNQNLDNLQHQIIEQFQRMREEDAQPNIMRIEFNEDHQSSISISDSGPII